MTQFKQKLFSVEDRHVFLSYLSTLNGFLCKAKNLHWAAKGKDIHEYLDDFHKILGDFQDSVAEGYMGILGKMEGDDVQYIDTGNLSPLEFIDKVISETLSFYRRIPEGAEFSGLRGETETFIQNVQKYKYLFNLCYNDSIEN